jgi:hypothetical protein
MTEYEKWSLVAQYTTAQGIANLISVVGAEGTAARAEALSLALAWTQELNALGQEISRLTGIGIAREE